MTGPVPPELYAQVFEDDKRGAAILEDLAARFANGAVRTGGIDAVLQTFYNMGQRSVVDFMVMRINQAKGVGNVGESVDLSGTGGE